MASIYAVILRTLKSRRRSIAIYIAVSVLLNWVYISLFPTFQQQSEQLKEIYSSLPESFFAAFGAPELAFASLEGFMGTENFGLLWPLLVIILTSGIAGAALAGEIEKDTIELVLSRPISRTKFFLGKYLAACLAAAAFIGISIFSIPLIAQLTSVDFIFKNYAVLAAAGVFYAWAIIGIGFLFSAFFSEKNKVLFATGGMLFVMYVLNIVAQLNDSLSTLKYASIFFYFKAEIVREATVPLYALLVLGGTAIITLTIALWRWNKRDIHV